MIKLTNLDVKKMTIGQMARMNHISEQTLRLYDREGLLSPLGRDEKNGYRYYGIPRAFIYWIISSWALWRMS